MLKNHKLKAIEKLVDNIEAMVILETGTNENNQLRIPNDNLQIIKENKM